MADPLSIAASIAGLLAIGGKVLSISASLSGSASSSLSALTRDVSSLRAVLLQIEALFHHHSSLPAPDEPWLLALQQALTECGDTFLSLDALLSSFQKHGRNRMWKKVKWTIKEKEVEELRSRIERYRGLMELLLGVKTAKATTNVENMLTQIWEKMTKVEPLKVDLRSPISWRQKLAKMEFIEADGDGGDDSDQDLANTTVGLDVDDNEWLVKCDKTKEWASPGVYGITSDEGSAPNFEDDHPQLRSVLKMRVGKHQVELLCKIEDDLTVGLLDLWMIIKKEGAGDVFFIQLRAFGYGHRVPIPVGSKGLLFATVNFPGTVISAEDAKNKDPSEGFLIKSDGLAFLCMGYYSSAFLITFESKSDVSTLLRRLYGVRYLQRVIGFRPTDDDLVPTFGEKPDCRERPQLLQIGYANGKEKSYVYPQVWCFDDRRFFGSPRIVAKVNMHTQACIAAVDFSDHAVSTVGTNVILLSAVSLDAEIQSFAFTFQELVDAAHWRYSIVDFLNEYKNVSSYISTPKVTKSWRLPEVVITEDRSWRGGNPEANRYIWPNTTTLSSATVKLEVDSFYHSLKFDIIPAKGDEQGIMHIIQLFEPIEGDDELIEDVDREFNVGGKRRVWKTGETVEMRGPGWIRSNVHFAWDRGQDFGRVMKEVMSGIGARKREAYLGLLKL